MPVIQFKGKNIVQNHHLTAKYRELVPVSKNSLTKKASLGDNLVVHGDNLEALKALLPTFAGRIKCIYIDPPYNTGNEGWIYSDNVSSPMIMDWIGKTVDLDDLTRHDKWLCMMLPRLKLLRELLAENGSIWISIDDNEQARLKCVLDEIFGEENFIATIIWQKRTSRENRAAIGISHDFIVVYAKQPSVIWKDFRNLLPDDGKGYSNPDNDPRGDWRSIPFSAQGYRKNQMYKIRTPNGTLLDPPKGRCWSATEPEFKKLLADNRVYFPKDNSGRPRIKQFRDEEKGLVPSSLWYADEVGDTQEAKKEILDLFHDQEPFPTPKPVRLIKRIVQVATEKDSIVLDSFAGSGTTAHAVIELNKEDGGNRRFVLVEMENYANRLTAERVRRVMRGVSSQKEGKIRKGLGGSFSFFELGAPIEMESILSGKRLPSYMELSRYIYYTATGEEFDESKVKEKQNYIGSTDRYEIYLFYQPNLEYLKTASLTLEHAESLGEYKGKQRVVFAPTKYLDAETMLEMHIDYCQLPFEIYRHKG